MIKYGEKILNRTVDINIHDALGLGYDQLALQISDSEEKEKIQKKAITHFKKFLSENIKLPKSYRNLGLIYLHQNKLKLSLKYCIKAYKLDKKDIFTPTFLGNVYGAKGEYVNALKWYKKSLRYEETKSISLLNIANIYAKQHKNKLAQKYARMVLENLPKGKKQKGVDLFLKSKSENILRINK